MKNLISSKEKRYSSNISKSSILRQDRTMEHIKESLKNECEKMSFGSLYCTPILNKLTNAVIKDIGNEADITRICSYIRLCPKKTNDFNEFVDFENEQHEFSDVGNLKLTQSTANMSISAGHVCFSLFFIAFLKNFVIGL